MNNPVSVIIPPDYKPPKGDVEVAWILAKYYKTTIEILKPLNQYKVKTPDYRFLEQYFELKIVTSAQVRQLLVALKRAHKQSVNIVIDLRKSKILPKRAAEICEQYIKEQRRCRILIIISAKNIIDIC